MMLSQGVRIIFIEPATPGTLVAGTITLAILAIRSLEVRGRKTPSRRWNEGHMDWIWSRSVTGRCTGALAGEVPRLAYSPDACTPKRRLLREASHKS